MMIKKVATISILAILILSSISVIEIGTGERTVEEKNEIDDRNSIDSKESKQNRVKDRRKKQSRERKNKRDLERLKRRGDIFKKISSKKDKNLDDSHDVKERVDRVKNHFRSLLEKKQVSKGDKVGARDKPDHDHLGRRTKERVDDDLPEVIKRQNAPEIRCPVKPERTGHSLNGMSGSISGTWNGTINITKDVYVQHGTTLEIKPGSEIYFNKSTSMYINGTLKAVGTADDEILFTSNATGPAAGDWNGLVFNSSTDEENSIIDHANISYAKTGITFDQTSPPVTNCNITLNNNGVKGSEMNVSNNTIADNIDHGVTVNEISSVIDIHDNQILKNSDGINLTAGVTDKNEEWFINITGNEITSRKNGIYLYGAVISNNSDATLRTDIKIKENRLLENGEDGLAFHIYNLHEATSAGQEGHLFTDLSLKGNNASDNGGLGTAIMIGSRAVYGDCKTLANLTIRNSRYYNNALEGLAVRNYGYQESNYNYTANMTAELFGNHAVNNSKGFDLASAAAQNHPSRAECRLDLSSQNNRAVNNTNTNFEVRSKTDTIHQAYSNVTADFKNETVKGHNRTLNGFNFDSGELGVEGGASLTGSVEGSYIHNNTHNGINATEVNLITENNEISENGKTVHDQTITTDYLADDFNDRNMNGWHREGGTWSVTSGELRGSDPTDTGYCYYPNETFHNFTYEVDFTPISDEGRAESNILFRYQDVNNYYCAEFDFDDNRANLNRRYLGGGENTLTFTSVTMNIGTRYHAKIVCEGQSIEVYLDGSLLISWTDSVFLSGEIGVAVDNSVTDFDNIELRDTQIVSRRGVGIRMVEHTQAIIRDDKVNDNGMLGLHTDPSSEADLIATDRSEIYNNSAYLNGDVIVRTGGKLSCMNGSMEFRAVEIQGIMEALPGDMTEVISENVRVEGDLWLNNTVWRIDSSYDGEYHINVTSSGHLVVRFLSKITRNKTSAYEFWVQEGGELEVYDSTIEYCGWDSPFTKNTGIWLNSDDVYIFNTEIREGYNGVVVDGTEPEIVRSEITTNEENGENGIYILEDSHPYITDDCVIFDNNRGILAFSTGFTVENSTIRSNDKEGIKAYQIYDSTIANNDIYLNDKNGIYLYSPRESITIKGNKIQKNSQNGIHSIGESGLQIQNNIIQQNNERGIFLQSYDEHYAGLRYSDSYRVTYFGFGFETINGEDKRNQTMDRTLTWLNDSADSVLLIDDDGGKNLEQYYNTSLKYSGFSGSDRCYWETSERGLPDHETLEENQTVIWFTGDESTPLNSSERANLKSFLDAGGDLFVTGNRIGDIDGEVLYDNYFHADTQAQGSGIFNLKGVKGDPITDDLNLNTRSLNGDRANYGKDDLSEDHPEVITPQGDAEGIFLYDHQNNSDIFENYIRRNDESGIRIEYNDPTIHDNWDISKNSKDGIFWTDHQINSTIHSNDIIDNDRDGIRFETAGNLTLEGSNFHDNTISDNSGNGIVGGNLVDPVGNVTVNLTENGNSINNNGENGTTMVAAYQAKVELENIEAVNNGYSGVRFTSVSGDLDVEVYDSNFSSNGEDGSTVYETSGLVLVSRSEIIANITDTKASNNRNTAGSSGIGFLVESSKENCTVSFENVTASENSDTGIDMRAFGNMTVSVSNTITNNNGLDYGTGLLAMAENYDCEAVLTNVTANGNDGSGIVVFGERDLDLYASGTETKNNVPMDGDSAGIFAKADDGNCTATVEGATSMMNDREGIGIYADDKLNLTVKDTVTNDNGRGGIGYGIFVTGETCIVTLSDNEVSSNQDYGVYLESITQLEVDFENNVVSENQNGIYLRSHGDLIEGTLQYDSITMNENNGTEIYYADGLELIGEDISENGNTGLYLSNCRDTRVHSRTIISYNGRNGIYIVDSPENTLEIYNLEINSNGDHGIYVDSSSPHLHDNVEINCNGEDFGDVEHDNGIYVTDSHNGLRIEDNPAISQNMNNGITVINSTDVYIESNIIKGNYRGIYSASSELIVGNNTIEYNLGSGNSNEGGGITAVTDTDLTLYNNHISHNLIYGLFTDNSSTSNWYVDGSAKAESNMLILRGNIEVQNDGVLTLRDIQGSLPNGLSIGIYLRSKRNNKHHIEVNTGGEMNVINSRMSSYSGDSYTFVVRGDMELTGATISRAYTIELHSNDIQIEGSTIRDGWHGGIAVYSSSPTIEGSSLINNTYYGLYLNDSAPNIDDLHISDNREGILLEYTNVKFRELELSGNDRGIKAEDDSSFEVYNSTLSNTANDLYLMENSTGWVVNTDFDKTSSRILDTSELHVNWYCDVVVKDHHGNAVSGATVNIYNRTWTLVDTGTTDDIGRVENFVLKEYLETSSGKTYTTEHNLTTVIGGTEYSLSETIDESKTVMIEVNNDPTITSSPATEATEDEEYYYNVEASDTNLDSLYFSLTERPTGMSIDHTTGEISWTPTNGQVGNHSITVKVVDDHGGSDTQTWTISVTNINDAPNITSSPVTIVLEDQAYEYDVEANDVDVGDALSYSLTVAPDNMSIDSFGLIEWTPNDEDVGEHNIFVKVEDTNGASDTQSYTITVQNVNDAPVIHEQTLPEAEEDTVYSFFVEAHDIDDDPLVYTLTEKPSGMSIDTNSGEISWTPTNGQVGRHNVTVKVNDGNGGTDNRTWNLTVMNVNDAPEIISDPVTVVEEDSSYLYNLKTVDIDGDDLEFSLKKAPSGMGIDIETGSLNWTPENEDVGEHFVTVEVTDGNGSVMQSFELTVNNVNDAPLITSEPQKNATEDSEYVYDVEGIDVDDDELIYSLSEKPTGMTIEQSSGVISWVPSDSDVGEHSVKVRCIDGNGGVSEQKFLLKVENLNDAPHLSGATVSPRTGDEKIKRTFRVTYQDDDGDAPSAVYVVIDGKKKEMKKVSSDEDYSKGVVYSYRAKLDSGGHIYRFETSDVQGGVASTAADNIEVKETEKRWTLPLILISILLIVLIVLVILDIYWWRYRDTEEEEKRSKEPKEMTTTETKNDTELESSEESEGTEEKEIEEGTEDTGESEDTESDEVTDETEEEVDEEEISLDLEEP